MLEEDSPHSIESFQRIQGDNKLLSAEELMPYLSGLQFDDAELAGARDWLLTWDYQFDMDSPQAALYAQFWARLMDNLFNDELFSEELDDGIYAHGIDSDMWSVFLLMQEPDNPWWDDVTTEDAVETRDDILLRSFREAHADTVAALGDNRDKWAWGDLHTATFVSNPLGASGTGIIEGMVNRGPYAVGGSTATVNNTVWVVAPEEEEEDFTVTALPSMRMIVDLGDLTRSVTMHTTGQSGHPASPHYEDMVDSWRTIEYHPMLWTREQVEAAAVDRLVLSPPLEP